MKHNFEERRQNRIEYAHAQAEKNKQQSTHYYVLANKLASVIPMGQPILVGHYSEKGHRTLLNKIHNTQQKSWEAQGKADYYSQKANTIENNQAIFSDDPQALDKLREKLKSLQDNQAFMKTTSRYIRKQDKASFLALPYATEKMWEQLNTPDCLNRIGFPDYSLKNNNGNIARIKQRIAQLEKQSACATKEAVFEGVRLVENTEANRVQLFFENIPDKPSREMLKKEGFRWSPTEGAWQRHLNNMGIYAAKRALEKLNRQ